MRSKLIVALVFVLVGVAMVAAEMWGTGPAPARMAGWTWDRQVEAGTVIVLSRGNG